MRDEEGLARRAQQRDQQAFAQLTENMTEQVFVNALQSSSSFKEKGIPCSAWLSCIARNQVVEYLRKKTKQATVPLDESRSSIVALRKALSMA